MFMYEIETGSQALHWLVFRCTHTSLCGRAYMRQFDSAFWRLWVMIFTEKHCRKSMLWHVNRRAKRLGIHIGELES